MLREEDFEVVGYCSKCNDPKYSGPENKIYFSCFCRSEKIAPKKLKIVPKQEYKKEAVILDNREYYEGYTA